MRYIKILFLLLFVIWQNYIYAENDVRGVVLLITNQDYKAKEDKLNSPINDGKALKKEFEKLNLKVCPYNNVKNTDDMKKKIDFFIEEVEDQIKNNENSSEFAAIIYYSGHGMSYTYNDITENYIVPIEANLESDLSMVQTCTSVYSIYERLNKINCKNIIIIYDACRTMKSKETYSRTALKEYGDSWILFSAGNNEIAVDGKKGGISPFCDAFIKTLNTSNISGMGQFQDKFNDIFKNEHPDIADHQHPKTYSGFTNFTMNPSKTEQAINVETPDIGDGDVSIPFNLKPFIPWKHTNNSSWVDWALIGFEGVSAFTFLYCGTDQCIIKKNIPKSGYTIESQHIKERERGKRDAQICRWSLGVLITSYLSKTILAYSDYSKHYKSNHKRKNDSSGFIYYPSIDAEGASFNLALTF